MKEKQKFNPKHKIDWVTCNDNSHQDWPGFTSEERQDFLHQQIKYKCTDCMGEFLENEMTVYQRNIQEGICKECMKKRG